jgi:hypothetical protein
MSSQHQQHPNGDIKSFKTSVNANPSTPPPAASTPPSSSSISPGNNPAHNKSFGFTSFVGALTGVSVKNMMGGLAGNNGSNGELVPTKSTLSPQAQKHMKSLSNSLDKLKLQTSETHLGLILAYSDSLTAPITNPDFVFNWFRVEDQKLIHPILLPGHSLSNGWYPPCADDIGHVIRLRCTDSHRYGVIREIDSEVIRPDEELVDRVEHAIYNDRITAKVIVSSLPDNLATSPKVCPVNDFEIAGSIEIGSKGILICEKGVDHCGLRFYPSPAVEVRCSQTSSFILRIPIPQDRTRSVITWAGKSEGCLSSIVEKYLGNSASPPAPLLKADESTQFLELMVSCRDRLVRDTLVISTRSLAAYLATDTSTPEASIQERLETLPWSDMEDHEEHDVVAMEPSSSTPAPEGRRVQSLVLVELQETRESLEREKLLNKELKSSQSERGVAETGSPTSTLDTRSLSCNDLSLLSSSKTVVPHALSMPLRHREESGYTSESFFDETPRPMAADEDAVIGMRDEISLLKERCETLTAQNRLLHSETERYRSQATTELLQLEFTSPSAADAATDAPSLSDEIEHIFSQAEGLFHPASPPSPPPATKEEEVNASHENTHDHDSETCSGTDSSEHSQENSSSPDHRSSRSHHRAMELEAQKALIENLEHLFHSLHDKFLQLQARDVNHQQAESVKREQQGQREREWQQEMSSLVDKSHMLASQCQLLEQTIETQRQQHEATVQRQRQEQQQQILELTSSHQAKEGETEALVLRWKQEAARCEEEIQRLTELNHEVKRELCERRQQSNQLVDDLRREIASLSHYNSEILGELSHLKERHGVVEQRNHDLQQELLEVSDAKQSVMKQLNSLEVMRKQQNQMKSTMNSLNHELQSVNELLRESQERNEKLTSMHQLTMSDLEYQKKLVEKMTCHVSEMRERNESLESNLQSVETNKSSLMKENNRLRNTINTLSRDKKKLDEMEPLYLQQLEHLASIHSKTTELETMLGRMIQCKNETVLQLLAYELRYGRLEKRFKELLVSYHHSAMVGEDLSGQQQRLEQALEAKEFKIKLLKQDLNLSKQAEPFVVKKLNYLLSKLNGEKNHYQQKVPPPSLCGPLPPYPPQAKSLSRDLQKRLLEGTPLQRELGRVTMRLEEVPPSPPPPSRPFSLLSSGSWRMKGTPTETPWCWSAIPTPARRRSTGPGFYIKTPPSRPSSGC